MIAVKVLRLGDGQPARQQKWLDKFFLYYETKMEEYLWVLERYGFERIADKIRLIQSDPLCLRRYLDSLIINQRSAPRNGFPPDVMSALIALSLTCHPLYQEDDVWDNGIKL